MTPLFTNDAVVLGILLSVLALVYHTSHSSHPLLKKFYTVVPALLLCYFIPALLSNLGIYDPEQSKLYFVASRYLLPACLVLFTLSTDLKEIFRLGPKALILFLTGTLGVMIGAPLTFLLFQSISPETVAGDGIWRGLSTIAGSWIGGGANQAAMKEVYQVDGSIFSVMVAVDVVIGSIWMGLLLYGAQHNAFLNKKLRANSDQINALVKKLEKYQLESDRISSTKDYLNILGIAFGAVAISHMLADFLAPWFKTHWPESESLSLTSQFFWIIVIATTIGMALSFTRARKLEGAGASRIGSVFIYLLVATIGMQMNVKAIFDHPGLFVFGAIWIMIHGVLMLIVARILKAPFFYVAVGSQANIGAAASAPVVAAAFHPTLAPVGVLLAVLGYGIGTYGAWIVGQVLRAMSQ